MAQFDVYTNPNTAQRAVFPYLVQVQHDSYDGLPTRMVIPLQRARIPPSAFPRRLTETVGVDGEILFMAVHLAAALPARLLRRPVTRLGDQHAQVRDALDALISGI